MGVKRVSPCCHKLMNTSCSNSLLILCVVLWSGCDSGQAPPVQAPAAPKPVVFNPSIPMKEVKPGQYTRVTSTRQQVTLTRGFWMGSHEVTQREFESAMGITPSFFKGETLPVD